MSSLAVCGPADLASGTVSVALQETDGWLPCGLFTEFTVGARWQRTKPCSAPRAMWIARDDCRSGLPNQVRWMWPMCGWSKLGHNRLSLPTSFHRSVVRTWCGTARLNWADRVGPPWEPASAGVTWTTCMARRNLAARRALPVCGSPWAVSARRCCTSTTSNRWSNVNFASPQPVWAGSTWNEGPPIRSRVICGRMWTECGRCWAPRADPSDGRAHSDSRSVHLATSWQRYSLTFRPEHDWVFIFAGPDLAEEQRVDVLVDAVQLEQGEQATPFQPRSAWEFAVTPAQTAGVFVLGERAVLHVRLCNHGAAARRVTVDFQVSDYADQSIAMPPMSVDVPAARRSKRTGHSRTTGEVTTVCVPGRHRERRRSANCGSPSFHRPRGGIRCAASIMLLYPPIRSDWPPRRE